MKRLLLTILPLLLVACAAYSVKDQQDDIKQIAVIRKECTEAFDGLEEAQKEKHAKKIALSEEILELCFARGQFFEADTPEVKALRGVYGSSRPPNRVEFFKMVDAAEKSIRDYQFKK